MPVIAGSSGTGVVLDEADASSSAVSWAAIIAGAVATAALALVLSLFGR
jgi:hypothetical protein